jgi:hypothetical protein
VIVSALYLTLGGFLTYQEPGGTLRGPGRGYSRLGSPSWRYQKLSRATYRSCHHEGVDAMDFGAGMLRMRGLDQLER